MANRREDENQQRVRPGPEISYAVVARGDGAFCVEFMTPSGRTVVVGQFRSEQEAKAWIESGKASPTDP